MKVMIRTAIWKSTSRTVNKPFELKCPKTRKRLYFKTLREAKVQRNVHLFVRKLIKKRYDSLPKEEKRKQNLQRNGNNSNLERQVARKIKAMLEKLFSGSKVIILNDGTRADILIQRSDGLFLQIQLKTTSSPRIGCWQFKDVLGYTGMPVLCWRDDQDSGWLYDGTLLDERGVRDLKVTPGKGNEKKAMHEGALTMEELCKLLVEVQDKYTGVDEISATWDFPGKAINTFKERVSLEIWKKLFDCNAIFPDDQNGSYDLMSKSQRLQFKLAGRISEHRGLKVSLRESGGNIKGKRTNKPYRSGSFDAVVVMFIDWKFNKVHIWKIPERILVERKLLQTDDCKGQQGFYVFIPEELNLLRKNKFGEVFADVWTNDYYVRTEFLPSDFGIEAETVAARFFEECRK